MSGFAGQIRFLGCDPACSLMTPSKDIEKALFDVACELSDPAVRASFLDQACNGNPELRERLEKLLLVHASTEEFFGASPLHSNFSEGGMGVAAGAVPPPTQEEADPLETTNTVIGRYKLLQRLGEGGCGVVYQAEQQEPVRRRVALKIIRLGMDTESVIARFQAERQALAMMDHPNIAHVLDAGATEAGRPYFVMELVQGVKVTDYCNQNHLDVRRRLDLFIQICHALQHAHQKGVIHRDVKPSNILVSQHDGVPVPKVIDFGIAKATEGRLADSTIFTAYDQFIGTPAYMSPEQANRSGLDVDTRSDIYSLGVLLYELLTGRTPFDSKKLMSSGMDEMRRTLREREPQPPSTMLTTLGNTELTEIAAQHHAEPLRFISSLRGDLDWIVMKSLEKDRRRRYETANGLAMDVQRYLNNEPVIARPPSTLYRCQKLVRRNKLTFTAIAAVTLALLVGLGMAMYSLVKEHEALRRVMAAEQQQFRLREEADRLRQEAEIRQKLTAATFANSRKKIEEADHLVAGIPAPEPNLEYADLYRTLGDWHAANGRWKEAAERFVVLLQVNQPDDWDLTTLDYLRYGPVLLESGDAAGYERFRQSAIAHFARTTNPLPAERVVKLALLMPADTNLLAVLRPLANTAAQSLADNQNHDPVGWELSLAAWRAFSLALMEYRSGNYPSAEDWCQKSLAYQKENEIRVASVQVVLAMTHYHMGRIESARSELAQARQTIEKRSDKGLQTGDGYQGFWFDWLFGRILLREANALIQ
jgi:serine/threonine protein kinase